MELIENLDINNNKNSFFESTFGQVINNAFDTGLKIILPDFIEDDIINVKDTFINEGFSEAIKEAINSAVNIGKTAIGTITGNFESVSQAENAIKKGGLIDGVSDAIDYVLDAAKKSKIISKDVVSLIKKGKNIILDNVSDGIKNEFKIQSDKIEKLDKYNESWKEAYNNKDFKTMEKYIKKIDDILNNIIPIENIINSSHSIKNLHELIKNNGQDFNINEEQEELAKIFK